MEQPPENEKPKDRTHPQALEKIRPDLNLEKWSIWQPANSRNPLKTRAFEREITTTDGSMVTATVEIAPTTKGDLTTEDQKTYYALLKHWEDRGRPDQQTPFSIRQIAKVLKKRWGTNVIDSITQSLVRLRATTFIWNNSYFDSSTGETVKALDTFTILSELKIVQREKDGHTTKAAGYFKFNDFIHRNLKANHTKPLLLDTVLSFKSEIAQLLYTHVDLILSKNPIYERRSKELFDDLGLEGESYKNPSNRKQKLEKALKELEGKPLPHGFIASAKLATTKDGKDYKVVIRKSHSTAQITAGLVVEPSASAPINIQPTVKDQITIQAEELLHHFHQLFHGGKHTHLSSKAIAQAVSLIATHGYPCARHIVDYAYRVAPETNYQPITFGGIVHYEVQAAGDFETKQRQMEQEKQREEERLRAANCWQCEGTGYYKKPQGEITFMAKCTHPEVVFVASAPPDYISFPDQETSPVSPSEPEAPESTSSSSPQKPLPSHLL
jgi:hypothetical protein